MSKAALVIDMPKSCYGCDLTYQDSNGMYCGCTKQDVGNYVTCRPEGCPLRELPEKMQIYGKYPQPDGIIPSYKVGWNAYRDAISGDSRK